MYNIIAYFWELYDSIERSRISTNSTFIELLKIFRCITKGCPKRKI